MQQAEDKAQATIGRFAAADRILVKFHCNEAKLIPILQQIQDEYKFLSEEMISYVANAIGVPPSRVYGVATFYAHFSLTPKGKYIIRLCDGTACHVKKSHGILNALFERLNLNPDKHTTDDLMFTIETVSCLGACGLAPAVVINEKVYPKMTPDAIILIIDTLLKENE